MIEDDDSRANASKRGRGLCVAHSLLPEMKTCRFAGSVVACLASHDEKRERQASRDAGNDQRTIVTQSDSNGGASSPSMAS